MGMVVMKVSKDDVHDVKTFHGLVEERSRRGGGLLYWLSFGAVFYGSAQLETDGLELPFPLGAFDVVFSLLLRHVSACIP